MRLFADFLKILGSENEFFQVNDLVIFNEIIGSPFHSNRKAFLNTHRKLLKDSTYSKFSPKTKISRKEMKIILQHLKRNRKIFVLLGTPGISNKNNPKHISCFIKKL